MLSKMLTEARPVRILAISCCRSVSALSIRALALFSTSRTLVKLCVGACSGFISVNEGSDGLSHRHTHYISTDVQIENDDRQLVLAAHRDGRSIHDFQILGEHVGIADF